MYVLHHADRPGLYSDLPKDPEISPMVGLWKGIAKPLGVAAKNGRAQVCTPVTNAHPVCRLLRAKKNKKIPHVANYSTVGESVPATHKRKPVIQEGDSAKSETE